MRLFFILALGRSGTNFLASLLAQDPKTRVHHQPDAGDPKLLALRYAGGFDTVAEALLEERFARLLAEAEGRGAEIYGEVNSYLRYETTWLSKRFQPTLIYLVRDGRDFVRSAFTRTVYTPWEEQQSVVPKDEDPYAPQWGSMSRFQRLCWYWKHTNEMLARSHGRPVQLERLLQDYDYLSERVLVPTGVCISREQWSRAVSKPVNTSEQDRRMRLLRRWILRRPQDQKIPPIPRWSHWDREMTEQFWQICGPTMEKMGYGTSESRGKQCG
jgi:hypothetical protein